MSKHRISNPFDRFIGSKRASDTSGDHDAKVTDKSGGKDTAGDKESPTQGDDPYEKYQPAPEPQKKSYEAPDSESKTPADDGDDGSREYDKYGYDQYGYDRDGYNADGYDQYGYDRDGFDQYGYNADGYDQHGYDEAGFARDGYNRDGYNADGYNEYGYDAGGYDRDGYDANGYDQDGFDRNGDSSYEARPTDAEDQPEQPGDNSPDRIYDENGYDQYGYNQDGYDANGYDQYGYDQDGYNQEGYDANGNRVDRPADPPEPAETVPPEVVDDVGGTFPDVPDLQVDTSVVIQRDDIVDDLDFPPTAPELHLDDPALSVDVDLEPEHSPIPDVVPMPTTADTFDETGETDEGFGTGSGTGDTLVTDVPPKFEALPEFATELPTDVVDLTLAGAEMASVDIALEPTGGADDDAELELLDE